MLSNIEKPTNLQECFKTLDYIIGCCEDGDWFLSVGESEAVLNSHYGLGELIRDGWGLWSRDSRIFNLLSDMGLNNADDMSSFIIRSYHRRLNNKDIEIYKQIENLNNKSSESYNPKRDY